MAHYTACIGAVHDYLLFITESFRDGQCLGSLGSFQHFFVDYGLVSIAGLHHSLQNLCLWNFAVGCIREIELWVGAEDQQGWDKPINPGEVVDGLDCYVEPKSRAEPGLDIPESVEHASQHAKEPLPAPMPWTLSMGTGWQTMRF